MRSCAIAALNAAPCGLMLRATLPCIHREEPVASMDTSGKIIWARHNDIQTVRQWAGRRRAIRGASPCSCRLARVAPFATAQAQPQHTVGSGRPMPPCPHTLPARPLLDAHCTPLAQPSLNPEPRQVNVRSLGADTELADGERLPLAVKDLGACDMYPQVCSITGLLL